jgi:preprotein translocase subunit SecF
VIHSFTAAMTFGAVLVGSYTSIFIAAPLLIYLGVGQGRESAEDASPSAEAAPVKSPAKR